MVAPSFVPNAPVRVEIFFCFRRFHDNLSRYIRIVDINHPYALYKITAQIQRIILTKKGCSEWQVSLQNI